MFLFGFCVGFYVFFSIAGWGQKESRAPFPVRGLSKGGHGYEKESLYSMDETSLGRAK
jgi:hypothetical protein